VVEPRRGLWSALYDRIAHVVAPRRQAADGGPFIPRPSLHPPRAGARIAQDAAIDGPTLQWASSWPGVGCHAEGFLGYPILAELAQRPEYRRVVETIASEMTREWIILKSTGDDDKSERIAALTQAIRRYKLRDVFRKMIESDGFFGRGHLYIDTGDTDDPQELLKPIGNGRDDTTKAKIKKGALRRFVPIEPVWIYPLIYNTANPLADDWYKPVTWNVMGLEIDASRIITVIGREVPDLLKPAYSFGGLSLTQMVKPYVEKFIKDAMSISDLVASFSQMVLTTNLEAMLQTGGDEFIKRIEMFQRTRGNLGLLVLNGEQGESLSNVSAPLGGLDGLQAQSQEHICSVSGLPLIKYTGLTPTGLNASSEGEIRSFYDGIRASQEYAFREPLEKCLGIIQLSEFGEIDPEITFDFVPLWQLDEEHKVAIEKTKADIHDIYMNGGVVSPDTVRQALSADKESLYHGMDLSRDANLDVPPIPQDEPDSASEASRQAA
jgi:phage-related protein (TIGR01555 family)